MIVGFTTTYVISAYHHWSCEFVHSCEVYLIQHYVKSLSVTCDSSVVFSGYSGFLHNKTDNHEITEISLKMVINTIALTPRFFWDFECMEIILNITRNIYNMTFHFFRFNDLRWEKVVHFVEIGGIIDHHCLNLHL
jgi:hypothetical protein